MNKHTQKADAARYRFLRAKALRSYSGKGRQKRYTISVGFIASQRDEWPNQDAIADLDMAIDEAIAKVNVTSAPKGPKQPEPVILKSRVVIGRRAAAMWLTLSNMAAMEGVFGKSPPKDESALLGGWGGLLEFMCHGTSDKENDQIEKDMGKEVKHWEKELRKKKNWEEYQYDFAQRGYTLEDRD
jgi:hypothetical protein